MAKLPEKTIQVAMVHAPLITSVVAACQNKLYLPLLEPELIKAENNGWNDLIKRIRKILSGNRKSNLLIGLDEEDAAIIISILVGLQNPEELKKINGFQQSKKQGKLAPSALSKLIISVHKDPSQKKLIVDPMLNQMRQVEGDMNSLSKIINKLCNKDYDIEEIKLKMTEEGRKMVDTILEDIL